MRHKNAGNLFVLAMVLCGNMYAQTCSHKNVPQRLILNLTPDPAHSMAVTWRTIDAFQNSEAQFAEASDWKDFEKSAKTVKARMEPVRLDSPRVAFHYSAILDGLKPNTMYAYSVGHDSVWSEWNQFTTAKDGNALFQFVFFGDPQTDIKRHVSRIFREAFKKDPDAAFWLFAGDLISTPAYDTFWDEWFYAAGFIPGLMPMVMVPGNHEYPAIEKNGVKMKNLVPLWKPHFTLPENGVSGLEETSYSFDYQGVRFIMLNGTQKLEEQVKWMEPLLANNPNRWTIAAMHQPIYSTGKDRESKKYQDLFLSLYDRYSVDLVLQAHEHVYGRTFKLKNGEKVSDNDKGTVYVVSVSGTKSYAINERYRDKMVKMGNQVQLFQVITIDGNRLKYASYTATGALYDTFELNK
jgi:acid phosphatase type 7